ncbi:MAG: hypothetical protein V4525_15020 [Pseudomonadota bacterium]
MRFRSVFEWCLILLGGGMLFVLISEIVAAPPVPDSSWPSQTLYQEISSINPGNHSHK